MKQKTGRKLLSFVLTLAMVVGIMPGMSLTAYADDPYASIKNTTTVVKFDNKDWYLIDYDASTVTLLSKECVGASQYDSNNSSTYSGSTVETFVNTWYTENISADAKTAVSDNKMFLLTTDQANATTEYVRKCSKAGGAKENEWWLCSPGYYDEFECDAACVDGGNGVVNESGESVTYTLGVRPALKLNLSKVAFDSESKTFSIPTPYPLWVGGTQVNSANAGEILGDQTASYVAGSNTLTLNGATITTGHKDDNYNCESGIYYNGSELLNIVLADDSENTVEIAGGTCNSQIGICVDASSGTLPRLNISGKGQLTVSGSNYGIHAPIITIDGCDVTASGGSGIHSYRGSIEINGGSVYASATNYAIYAASDMVSYYVIINAGSKVTASGGNKAIFGSVKNVIAGTGWTDTAGTTGEANIAVGEHKRTELPNFKKVQFPAAHTHIFTYTASGDTITATCANEDGKCTLPPSTQGGSDHVAKLTIAAPKHTTYGDGKEAAAQITDDNNIQGEAKVQYQKKTSESTYDTATETAPTNAGTYKASITLGPGTDEKTATASVEYTIAKANPTANAPSGLTTTYGKTLADVTLTNPSGNTEGAWAWVEDATTPVGNAGSQIHKANFTPKDTANYNSVSNVDVSVTVNKAANPATVSSTASVKKGGNTVELADNVTKNGATGAISYAISGENKGCTLDANGKLTSGTTTGTVTVNVSITADDNYEALAATPITVTITEKDAQTITADDVTATYGDADKKVSATTTGDGAISYKVKDGSGDYIEVNATTGALTIKKAGTATVVVTAAETDTHAATTEDVTVTINKKALTIKAKDQKIYVGDTVPVLSGSGFYTVTGLVGEDKLTNEPALAYQGNPDNTKAGTYDIVPSGATASENYNISYENGKLTISQKPSGGGDDSLDPVKQVIDKIEALKAPYDETKVKEAREDYKNLTKEQKEDKRLTDEVMKKLTDAEDSVASGKVSELIAALADPSKASADDVAAAVAAYKALTADQKSMIPEASAKKLEDAVKYPAKSRKVTLRSVKAKKGRKAQAKWRKNAKANGYQLVYSTSKKFKKKTTKKVNVKSYKTVKKTVRKLKAKKKYYFKIRTYTKVYNPVLDKNEKVYGKWSNVKKAKAKK